MTSQALEQMLDNSFAPIFAQERMYQTIDTFASETTGLYSGPMRLPPTQPLVPLPYGQTSHTHMQPVEHFEPIRPVFEPIRPIMPHVREDYMGSMGKSMSQGDNYIKIFPNGDKLSVHAHEPEGWVSGAKFNNERIDNYQAAMYDLREGTIKKNTGGQW